MQQESFNLLVNRLRFPERAVQTQEEFNKTRLKLVTDALAVRPYYLPIVHTLPAAQSNTPIPATTDQVRFPLVIHGAISDGEDRFIRYYINRNRKALIGFGRESAARLSLRALAGQPVAIAGFPGVQALATPMPLDELDYLTVEMYQDISPGVEQLVTTCFNAVRVFPPNYSDANLTREMRELVLENIAVRPAPLTTYDIVPVTFTAGVALAETPQDDDPYLIHGFRSTFTDAMISLGYDDQRGFSKQPFPIWAVAAENGNTRTPWEFLKVPLFMGPKEKIHMRLLNTIDGVNFATNGQIEVLRSTV